MKKTIALVVAGIVAGATLVTGLPHRAADAAAPKRLVTAYLSEAAKYSSQGMIVRAVYACVQGTGTAAGPTTCAVLQDP